MTQVGDFLPSSHRGFGLALAAPCPTCRGMGSYSPATPIPVLQGHPDVYSYGSTQAPPRPCDQCRGLGFFLRVLSVEELMTLLALASEKMIVGTK